MASDPYVDSVAETAQSGETSVSGAARQYGPLGPRPTPMDDTEFQSVVRGEIQDAIDFIDTSIGIQRQQAELYYRGALFGDEQEGRSQVVSRDVHDTVNGILPDLLRVFFGPDKIVEFVPEGPQDVDTAEQATDYIDYIVQRDNDGFMVFWDCFRDALINKTGVIKYWWDKSIEVTEQTYSGLDPMAVQKLLEDLQGAQEASVEEMTQDENGVSLRLKLKKSKDRARIQSLAPEELLIDRRARNSGIYTLIGQRTDVTKSELKALGYTDQQIERAGSSFGALDTNLERLARLPAFSSAPLGGSTTHDETLSRVLYCEVFVRADRDGDGIAELHRVCTAGPGFAILHSEVASSHCFACFPCDPQPHTFFGDSIAEKTMDIQKIKTGILRSSLDSLALSIFPRTVVARKGVNIDDVLNTEIGAVIRADNPNMVVPLVTPFVGQQAFPMLEYMDQVRESRTGISKASQGLDPGTLQNMTALAAAQQFQSGYSHKEMIARVFAETGMKDLFRGLLRLVAENQRAKRVINLRGQWVEVDPRGWRADMEVTCNVALGAGTSKEKSAVLAQVIDKQEKIMMTAGPNNPLVQLTEYRNAISDFLALNGFKNPTKYFKDVNAEQLKQLQQNAKPPPDPRMAEAQMRAQIEMAKLKSENSNKQADRDQALRIAIAEIMAKYKTTIETAQIKASSEALRTHADLIHDAVEAGHEVADLRHTHEMDRRAQTLAERMASQRTNGGA